MVDEITADVNTTLERLLITLGDADWAEGKDARRLFHGRGQCYPGLEWINVDHYGEFLLITLYRQAEQDWLQALVNGLEGRGLRPESLCVAVQHRYKHPGINSSSSVEVLRGKLPEKPYAIENGLSFELNLSGQQNTGFFLDMAPGRHWLAERAAGKRILNLFSYTCSFSVAALGAGAKQVVNLDMSKAALAQGQRNHQRNGLGLASGAIYLPHNLFKAWKRLSRYGGFDACIIDPPSRQPGSFVAERDYGRVLTQLPELLISGADVLVCLNAPGLSEVWLRDLVREYWPRAEYIARLRNREDFPESDPERNLKMLHYCWQG